MKAMCKLCGAAGVYTVFEDRIRTGSVGSMSDCTYKVLECTECGVQYLSPFPDMGQDFYVSEQYRQTYDNSDDINTYFKKHDDDQISKISRIGMQNLQGKVIADFGCGGGSFLDMLRGRVGQTIAVEPFQRYHSSLKERGHEVFQWGKDVSEGILDLAVTFDVIEHVEDPLAFLGDIYRSLKPGGVAHIITPNRKEILMQLHKKLYSNFYYRTAHLWYFDSKSLTLAASQAGFKDINTTYHHKYDLSNMICWLKDNEPSGLNKTGLFDDRLNHQWSDFLEEKGLADSIWIVAHKDNIN